MSMAAKDQGTAAMEIDSVAEALEWHARHCDRAGAPITFPTETVAVSTIFPKFNEYAGLPFELGRISRVTCSVAATDHRLHLGQGRAGCVPRGDGEREIFR